MTQHGFPDGFLWGVATSAQQIEGARREGGRGDSIWDHFSEQPGKIADASNPSVACDHYHRWRQDVDILQWLGVDSYRFSISWPRIMPTGRRPKNSTGLDFYDALVDTLLEKGIHPFVTLNHWDLPFALQENGGWATRSTSDAFVEYAHIVAERLADRVKSWVTHNEPWCMATLGHENGEHAPGHHDPAESLVVAHHLLLSHGWAVNAIRTNCVKAEIGIVCNLLPLTPASASDQDRNCVRQLDGIFNRWYLDPLFNGRYPQDAIQDRVEWKHLADDSMSFVQPGDMQAIAVPTDFLGVNYYSRAVIKSGENGRPEALHVVPEDELTDMGWEVYPEGLYDLLLRLNREFKPPRIYITENGCAYSDEPDASGRIRDVRRIEYLRQHLLEALRARNDGVPLEGYFLWSLLDNFEWAHGYEKRFGITWVDFETQERIPKDSAHWYRATIASNAVAAQPDQATRRVS